MLEHHNIGLASKADIAFDGFTMVNPLGPHPGAEGMAIHVRIPRLHQKMHRSELQINEIKTRWFNQSGEQTVLGLSADPVFFKTAEMSGGWREETSLHKVSSDHNITTKQHICWTILEWGTHWSRKSLTLWCFWTTTKMHTLLDYFREQRFPGIFH